MRIQPAQEESAVRVIVVVLLLLAAHFSLTPFAPAPAGRATFYWPFATDSRPILAGSGILTPLFAGLAGLCLVAAVAALFGVVAPAGWWRPLVGIGAVASLALNVLYLSPHAVLPILIDVALLAGLIVQRWTVSGLRGG